MEKKSKKVMTLIPLEENLTSIENTLNEISDSLYGGNNLDKEELLELNSKLSGEEEHLADIADAVDSVLKNEKSMAKKSRFLLRLAIFCNIGSIITGNYILPILLIIIQHYVYENIKKESNEVIEYLVKIADRGASVGERILHYEETTSIKIKKKLQVNDELSNDTEKNAKFDFALGIVNYLLRGYNIDEIDDETIPLVKAILKDGGAEGDTIEELTASMRSKIESQKGGEILNKK